MPQVSTAINPQPMNPVISAAAGPKCNIVWVESIDEVLAHPTSPSEEMYFQDKNNPVIYRRETDANGNIKNPIHALHCINERELKNVNLLFSKEKIIMSYFEKRALGPSSGLSF